ncbi:HU family DNA-binding protein [Shimia sp. FJ5]|uniref:HU family DNA-binding protein n=1 Tax=Shimia sp. FJ5 TaxID=3079054 RepID=UPI002627B3F9|nr:HU family DNA-binding protein [Shimia sp. FJ5]MDV4143982.1 HU family DNA-binding protein [Shimia sp. FJ5]
MAKTTTTRAKSTTRKPASTARKTTTKRKTASAAAAKPVVVNEAKPVVAGPEMKKKELIDMVVERSGIKKRFAKPTVEAMLAVLGEALDEGRELNLRPFGKMKVQRAKEVSNGKVMNVRLRQPKKQPEGAKEGVAEAAE